MSLKFVVISPLIFKFISATVEKAKKWYKEVLKVIRLYHAGFNGPTRKISNEEGIAGWRKIVQAELPNEEDAQLKASRWMLEHAGTSSVQTPLWSRLGAENINMPALSCRNWMGGVG